MQLPSQGGQTSPTELHRHTYDWVGPEVGLPPHIYTPVHLCGCKSLGEGKEPSLNSEGCPPPNTMKEVTKQ